MRISMIRSSITCSYGIYESRKPCMGIGFRGVGLKLGVWRVGLSPKA